MSSPFSFTSYPITVLQPEQADQWSRPHWIVTGPRQKDNDEILFKMLQAARIDQAVDLVRLELQEGDRPSLMALMSSGQPQTILLFGIPPEQIGWQIELPQNEPTEVQGIWVLLAPSLSALAAEKDQPKRPLAAAVWRALQQMYLTTA